MGGALGVLAIASGALYLERFAIARWSAQSWLRERGVEGLVTVRALDLGHFSGALRLGDPRHPALSVERIDVDYDLRTPLTGGAWGVRTRRVVLTRPTLAARFTGGKLSFGVLQPIVDEALRRPPTGPAPAVLIRQGEVTTLTDAGPVVFTGDADLARGALTRLDGRLRAVSLAQGRFAFVSHGGPVQAHVENGVLWANASLDLTNLASGGLTLSGGDVAVTLRADYPKPKNGRFGGTGDLSVVLSGAHADGASGEADGVRGKLSLSGLTYAWDGRQFAATGAGLAEVQAQRFVAAGAAAQSAWSIVRLSNLALTAGPAGVSAHGDVSGGLDAARLTVASAPLADATASLSGPLSFGPQGLRLNLAGNLAGRSGLSPAEAQRVAAATPLLSGEPAYRQALARALPTARLERTDFRLNVGAGETRFTVSERIRIFSAGGAALVLTPASGRTLVANREGLSGAGRLTLAGGGLPDLTADIAGWSLRHGAVRADFTAQAALDYGPAQGLKTTAHARLTTGRRGFALALVDCAPLSIARLEGGEKDTTGIEGQVCPTSSPLVSGRGRGWVARGAFRDARADSELLGARAADASGRFEATGDRRGFAVDATIAGASLSDTQAVKRFEPVRAAGAAAFRRGAWEGALAIATPGGARLGAVRFRHDVATGVGAADIDAPALSFSKEGFQPVGLSPMADMVAGAEGELAFRGRFDWTRARVASAGRLTTRNFGFTSPAGEVHGLAADLAFTSLAPLVTAPAQTITAERIDALTPLTDVAATFTLDADRLDLAAASATAAKGRLSLEPMSIPLGGERRFAGAVRVDGVDLGEMIASSTLSDSVKLDAVVDGRLPFEVGGGRLRFVEGRLAAVRPGRISISRTALTKVETSGPATAPGEVNAVQDFAYQAMENLAFDSLTAEVTSRPNGRLGMLFRIQGRHEPEKREEAKISLLDLLRGRAFKQRIPLPADTPINLTLDTSLNFDELVNAVRGIWASKRPRSARVQTRSGQ